MVNENVAKNRSGQVGQQEVDNARVSFLQQVVPSGTMRPWLRTAGSPANVAPRLVTTKCH